MYLLTGFFNERYRQIDRFRQAVFLQSFFFFLQSSSVIATERSVHQREYSWEQCSFV